MEIRLEMSELRKRKLFVSTPMYGGQCHGSFCKSMVDLALTCSQAGIEMKSFSLWNESLITRARAYCCDEFMRSDSTHHLFIDSDIGFSPHDVLTMLAMQDPDPTKDNYDVISGPYPKKCLSAEKIVQAVKMGMCDENPSDIEKYCGDYVFNPKAGQTEIRIDEPVEVSEAGTGFMMIRRATFEKYKEAYPELSYRPDHVRTENFDGHREIMLYFDTIIDPQTRRLLSEDYMFCQYCWKIGLRVWLCPWVRLSHTGSYVFGGSLADIAAIGAAATCDVSKLKKQPLAA